MFKKSVIAAVLATVFVSPVVLANAMPLDVNAVRLQSTVPTPNGNVPVTPFMNRPDSMDYAYGNPKPITGTEYRHNVEYQRAASAGQSLYDAKGDYTGGENKPSAAQTTASVPMTAIQPQTPTTAPEPTTTTPAATVPATSTTTTTVPMTTIAPAVQPVQRAAAPRQDATSARLDALESSTNQHFADLNKQMDDNRSEARAGTAGAIAIASLPQPREGQTFMVSAGAGTYASESAAAVGVSANVGASTVVKLGFSDDTQSNVGAGVGVGFGF